MPTVASVSVTANPVVLTAEVGGTSAKAGPGRTERAGKAAIPIRSLRRSGDIRPLLVSSDMSTPSGSRTGCWSGEDCLELCTAQIRKIAYIAPQNSDVGLARVLRVRGLDRKPVGSEGKWQGGSG